MDKKIEMMIDSLIFALPNKKQCIQFYMCTQHLFAFVAPDTSQNKDLLSHRNYDYNLWIVVGAEEVDRNNFPHISFLE